jgi:hypothetical protein
MNRMYLVSLMTGVLLVPATLGAQDVVNITLRAPDTMEAAPPVAQPRIELFATPQVSRPPTLPALYVSLGGLQAYDGYSTVHGVKNGARESNVLLGGLAGNPAAFWAIKGGSTALSIFMAERLWRSHHRAEAIVTMVVANSVMAAIAARNTSVIRSSR